MAALFSVCDYWPRQFKLVNSCQPVSYRCKVCIETRVRIGAKFISKAGFVSIARFVSTARFVSGHRFSDAVIGEKSDGL